VSKTWNVDIVECGHVSKSKKMKRKCQNVEMSRPVKVFSDLDGISPRHATMPWQPAGVCAVSALCLWGKDCRWLQEFSLSLCALSFSSGNPGTPRPKFPDGS
jgi:hypothetical protein